MFSRLKKSPLEASARALRPLLFATPVPAAAMGGILLYVSGGTTIAYYAPTAAGLAAANAAAASGDILVIPLGTFASDITLAAGLHVVGLSRWGTILTGQVTLGVGTTVETLSIVRTSSAAATLKGLIGAASGTAWVRDVTITAANAGVGNAYAVDVESAGHVYLLSGCYIYGNASGGGVGYGGYRLPAASGQLVWDGFWAVGSTGAFNE